ncbi:MAG: oxidoreductase-like domain-containing protein [Motiliproteus sp.]
MIEHQLEKPERPEDWECCGGGCSPCIWDNYYESLTRWQEQQKELSATSNEGDAQSA